MGLARRGNLLWAAMVLGGAALGAYVLLAWPEATSRLVRLPYGESMPKSVRVAAAQAEQAAVAAPVAEEVRLPAVAPVAEPELATASPAGTYDGPPPVGSVDDGYVESAEELGAEPLPGFGPEPAPAAAEEETSTAAPAPSDEPDDEDEPVLDVVIELPQPPSAAE